MGRGEYTRKKTRNRNPCKSQLQFAEKCIKQIEPGNIDWLIKMTCLSFFCYVFDVGWDIYLLHRFWNQGDYWYFGWTLAIVVVPIVVITIKSFLFYNNEFEKNNELDPRLYLPQEENTTSNWLIKWGFGIVGFCLVQRFIDVIKYAHKAKPLPEKLKTDDQQNKEGELDENNKQNKIYMYLPAMIREDSELVQLSQFDSFMEAAPQLLLNLYILLVKDKSDFKVVKVIIGLIFSIVSLALAIVTYEQKLYLVEGIKPNEDGSLLNDGVIIKRFNQTYRITSAILFSAHLCWIVARLIALSLFASVFGWIVVPVCLAHLIPIFVWHWRKNYRFMASLRLSFLHVFAYLYPAEKRSDKEKHPRISPVMYQTICICENLALMVMWSQSLIKFDEGINPGILSISYYPWSDWTFFVPWIGQISTFTLSFISFWVLEKVRKENEQTLPTTDPTVREQAALANPYHFRWCW